MRTAQKPETIKKYKRAQDMNAMLSKHYDTSTYCRELILNLHFGYKTSSKNEPLMRALTYPCPEGTTNECYDSDKVAVEMLLDRYRKQREGK